MGAQWLLLAHLHLMLSWATLLNVLTRSPDPPAVTPTVLGVDEFALRKGRGVFGTLLVDVTPHLPLTLWDGRDAWIDSVADGRLPALPVFAHGIAADRDAVRAGLTSPSAGLPLTAPPSGAHDGWCGRSSCGFTCVMADAPTRSSRRPPCPSAGQRRWSACGAVSAVPHSSFCTAWSVRTPEITMWSTRLLTKVRPDDSKPASAIHASNSRGV